MGTRGKKGLNEYGHADTVATVLPSDVKGRLDDLIFRLRKSRINTMPVSMCLRLLLVELFSQCTDAELLALLEGKNGYSRSWYDQERAFSK